MRTAMMAQGGMGGSSEVIHSMKLIDEEGIGCKCEC